MYKPILLFSFLLTLLIVSCESINDTIEESNLSISKYKLLNNEQIQYLVDKGNLCEACPRTITCMWQDRPNKGINCDGGKCSLGSVSDGTTTSICLVCMNSDNTTRTVGECRSSKIVREDDKATPVYDETLYEIE
jgi:hypothetical protein